MGREILKVQKIFNPGLALIGLSGAGPWKLFLLFARYSVVFFILLEALYVIHINFFLLMKYFKQCFLRLLSVRFLPNYNFSSYFIFDEVKLNCVTLVFPSNENSHKSLIRRRM